MILLVKSDLEVNHPTIDLSQLVVQIRTFQIQIFSLIIILVIDLLTLVRHHQILQCVLKVKFTQKQQVESIFLYPLPYMTTLSDTMILFQVFESLKNQI